MLADLKIQEPEVQQEDQVRTLLLFPWPGCYRRRELLLSKKVGEGWTRPELQLLYRK